MRRISKLSVAFNSNKTGGNRLGRFPEAASEDLLAGLKRNFQVFDNYRLVSQPLGMARKLRVEYPGAICHVMNRGDHREAIFKDDKDRERFLETLGETCAKTGWLALA